MIYIQIIDNLNSNRSYIEQIIEKITVDDTNIVEFILTVDCRLLANRKVYLDITYTQYIELMQEINESNLAIYTNDLEVQRIRENRTATVYFHLK